MFFCRWGVAGDGVLKLSQLCVHKLQEDLSVIEDCRGIEFEVLAPVLERAKPETLIHIEEHNPYLMESTGTNNENTVGI